MTMKLLLACLITMCVMRGSTCLDHDSCMSAADCSKLHICFSGHSSLLGRRNIGTPLSGTCTLLKTAGQSCWVNGGTITSRPDHVVTNNLPCELGLYCKGIGVSLGTFGEAGDCVPAGQ